MLNGTFNKIFDGFQIRMKIQKNSKLYWNIRKKKS